MKSSENPCNGRMSILLLSALVAVLSSAVADRVLTRSGFGSYRETMVTSSFASIFLTLGLSCALFALIAAGKTLSSRCVIRESMAPSCGERLTDYGHRVGRKPNPHRPFIKNPDRALTLRSSARSVGTVAHDLWHTPSLGQTRHAAVASRPVTRPLRAKPTDDDSLRQRSVHPRSLQMPRRLRLSISEEAA